MRDNSDYKTVAHALISLIPTVDNFGGKAMGNLWVTVYNLCTRYSRFFNEARQYQKRNNRGIYTFVARATFVNI
jgi:hypothetical protein